VALQYDCLRCARAKRYDGMWVDDEVVRVRWGVRERERGDAKMLKTLICK